MMDNGFSFLQQTLLQLPASAADQTSLFALTNYGLYQLFMLPLAVLGGAAWLVQCFRSKGAPHLENRSSIAAVACSFLLLCVAGFALSFRELDAQHLAMVLPLLLLLCTKGFSYIARRVPLTGALLAALYAVCFGLFSVSYFAGESPLRTVSTFYRGFPEAAAYAESSDPQHIYVSASMPHANPDQAARVLTAFAFDLPASVIHAPFTGDDYAQRFTLFHPESQTPVPAPGTLYLLRAEDTQTLDAEGFDYHEFADWVVLESIRWATRGPHSARALVLSPRFLYNDTKPGPCAPGARCSTGAPRKRIHTERMMAMATAELKKKRYDILTIDPWLTRYEGDIDLRMARYKAVKKALLPTGIKLEDFANGDLYYGFHRTEKGWIYREWAPNATAMHLIGDFNKWNRESHPMQRLENGNWEIEIKGKTALKHLSRVKVQVTHPGGVQDHIPLYIHRVVQNPDTRCFDGQIWAPAKPFEWSDQRFSPKRNVPPVIYEAHIGMAQEKEGIGTYREFTQNILPRIKRDGYNTVQLMAVMEHPYYASFGYQVTNFFAASSWYGTPDDLKELVDTAHAMGISVLLDLVHSHAAKNVAEGINCFDGTDTQFFLPGGAGNHPAWDS